MGCKELVKDGVWQVPQEDRPKGWESIGAVEPETVTRTVKHTQTTHIVAERIETRSESSVEISEEVKIPAQAKSPEVSKTFSFVPSDPPETQEFLKASLEAYGDDEWDERIFDRIADLGERVHAYRQAKLRTDELLSAWVNRHRRTLRQIGIGSKPIQDLWEVVQAVMWEHRKLQRKAIGAARALRQAGDPVGADDLEALASNGKGSDVS